MTQIKNPIVPDGAGSCERAKLLAYILSINCKVSTNYFHFSWEVL